MGKIEEVVGDILLGKKLRGVLGIHLGGPLRNDHQAHVNDHQASASVHQANVSVHKAHVDVHQTNVNVLQAHVNVHQVLENAPQAFENVLLQEGGHISVQQVPENGLKVHVNVLYLLAIKLNVALQDLQVLNQGHQDLAAVAAAVLRKEKRKILSFIANKILC